jgi:hypothetical protein
MSKNKKTDWKKLGEPIDLLKMVEDMLGTPYNINKKEKKNELNG